MSALLLSFTLSLYLSCVLWMYKIKYLTIFHYLIKFKVHNSINYAIHYKNILDNTTNTLREEHKDFFKDN